MTTEIRAAEAWQLEADSADAYERYLATAFRPWAESLIGYAGLQHGERVLDVACGTGIVARLAASVAGAAGTVVGLDVNEDMLRVARAVSAGGQPSIDWRHGHAEALPFRDGAFDAVFCELAVQFFAHPVAALGEMRRVLAPGGRAAVSVCRPIRLVPAYAAMADALERHAGPKTGMMMRSPFPAWTIDDFRSLFAEAGFARTQVRIEARSLRYPSVEEFLRREAASSPLAGPIARLDPTARAGLIRELRSTLSDYLDDEGVVCPIQNFVALAWKD
jgi:ubiquinone/menaquinone biosynthesis C-methylase UbiE